MESESKTAVSWSTLSAAVLSKDGDLAATVADSAGVATPRLYRPDQPDLEDSVHQQDRADYKAGDSAVASVAHVVASEAASVATEEVSLAAEVSAIKVEAASEDGPTVSAVAPHLLQMLLPAQVVVVAAESDLVGMVVVRMVAHP
jgi:hypothetical protein